MKAHTTGLLAGLDEMIYVNLLIQAPLSVKASTFCCGGCQGLGVEKYSLPSCSSQASRMDI